MMGNNSTLEGTKKKKPKGNTMRVDDTTAPHYAGMNNKSDKF